MKKRFTILEVGTSYQEKNREFSVLWCVSYYGTRFEDWSFDSLQYHEWLCKDTQGELFYFTESIAGEDSYNEYELEVSPYEPSEWLSVVSFKNSLFLIRDDKGVEEYCSIMAKDVVKVRHMQWEHMDLYKKWDSLTTYYVLFQDRRYAIDHEWSQYHIYEHQKVLLSDCSFVDQKLLNHVSPDTLSKNSSYWKTIAVYTVAILLIWFPLVAGWMSSVCSPYQVVDTKISSPSSYSGLDTDSMWSGIISTQNSTSSQTTYRPSYCRTNWVRIIMSFDGGGWGWGK